MHRGVGDGGETGDDLLHPEHAVEGPLAVILGGTEALDGAQRHGGLHASKLAVGGAVPAGESHGEGELGGMCALESGAAACTRGDAPAVLEHLAAVRDVRAAVLIALEEAVVVAHAVRLEVLARVGGLGARNGERTRHHLRERDDDGDDDPGGSGRVAETRHCGRPAGRWSARGK